MQAYINTDQEIHALVQLLTKSNRTYLEARQDDSHTNLFFDPLTSRIYGRWLDGGSKRIILALNLDQQQFEILSTAYEVMHKIQVIDKTFTELEKSMLGILEKLGFNSAGFAEPLHYEIPRYSFAGKPFAAFDPEGLKQWLFFRSLANDAGAAVLGHLQIEGEVRVWPHHFDTGIYAQVSEGLGIGFGLAMADAIADEPYFYLAGYATKPLEFSGLPDLSSGVWATEGSWKGAYFALTQFPEGSLTHARAILDQFVLKCTTWYLEQ